MNRIFRYGCLFGIFVIAGCSSSDDGGGTSVLGTPAGDLQGTWASPCIADTNGNSNRFEFVFSGNNTIRSEVFYTGSATCDSTSTSSLNAIATFIIDGTETLLTDGNANNIDLLISGGTITASPDFLALFESQGTTLSAFAAAQGIGDINNVSLTELGFDQAEIFDIFRIDTTFDGTDQLSFGDGGGSFNANSPALRPVSLNANLLLLRIL